MDGISKGTWQRIALCKVLQERNEKNVNGRTICSVSVSQGVVNQVEYLGRSFAAKQTSHYNIVKYGDIVYTKSPTGNFPYGIIKRSNIREDVAVSPLYGVYIPASDSIGVFLHFYFSKKTNGDMELKVALCQFDMVWEDTAANLRTAGRMVAEADADLVILPEMFATGFVTDPGRVAQPMSGEIVQEMTRWVRTTGKAVAGSLIVEEEGRYYNRLLFIKPSGERVQSDKRHLFSIGGEGANFCPGRERGVVEYGGIRFLLQVCYDLRFPVWSRCRNDYDAIIYVASWPAGRRDVWRTLLRARAIENQAYVLGVNRTGDDPRLHYSGDSAVIGCKGETLAEAGEGQRLLTARLDMDELRRFREKFPAWRDADDFDLK